MCVSIQILKCYRYFSSDTLVSIPHPYLRVVCNRMVPTAPMTTKDHHLPQRSKRKICQRSGSPDRMVPTRRTTVLWTPPRQISTSDPSEAALDSNPSVSPTWCN
uniref:Uncharacterized protein n=1 Tax=Timema bartmani TaxID=61472 RepID=A0A7R9I799_9NEOP|nr:unnamed protein product [Timema bartmani]